VVLDGSDIYHMMSKVYVVRVISFANCNSCNLLPISSGVGSSVFFRRAVVSRCWEERRREGGVEGRGRRKGGKEEEREGGRKRGREGEREG